MCSSQQYATCKNPNKYPPDFVDPILIDGIFHEKTNAQHQDGYTNFVDEVFADKFFQIRIALKEGQLLLPELQLFLQ